MLQFGMSDSKIPLTVINTQTIPKTNNNEIIYFRWPWAWHTSRFSVSSSYNNSDKCVQTDVIVILKMSSSVCYSEYENVENKNIFKEHNSPLLRI